MRRRVVSRRRSRKLFSRTASKSHRRNSFNRVMRGGFRI